MIIKVSTALIHRWIAGLTDVSLSPKIIFEGGETDEEDVSGAYDYSCRESGYPRDVWLLT